MRLLIQRLLVIATVLWALACTVMGALELKVGLFMFVVPTIAVWVMFYALCWAFSGLKQS